MYAYRITGNETTVRWVDAQGAFGKPKTLYKGQDQAAAKAACDKHYQQAVRLAENAGRAKPQRIFD